MTRSERVPHTQGKENYLLLAATETSPELCTCQQQRSVSFALAFATGKKTDTTGGRIEKGRISSFASSVSAWALWLSFVLAEKAVGCI